jgi:hypothetical protein
MIIWAGTDDGNLQVTRDGGTTWTNVAGNLRDVPKGAWVTSLEPSVHQAGVCFATLDNHMYGDMKPYIVRTTDYGATWTVVSTQEITGYAHVVRQDHGNPSLLFAGTEDGLFMSFSAGASWLHVVNNFPPVAVRDLELQDQENALAIATHGRSLYVLDNIDVLRGINVSREQPPVTVIPPKPSVRRYSPSGSTWFGGDADFVGQSKSQSNQLWYILRDKHVKGAFVIRLKDSSGSVIRTFPASGRKGVNSVELPLSYQAPIAPKSQVGGAFGTFSGPLLPAGTYTIELDKAGQITTTTIKVVPDTTLGHSAEDTRLQYELVQNMYSVYEDLAVTTERLQSVIQSIERADSVARDTAVLAELISLNKTLVNTKQGAVTGEEQLREKLASLYGEVNGYLGRPGSMEQVLFEQIRRRVIDARDQCEKLVAGRLSETREQTYGRLKGQAKK